MTTTINEGILGSLPERRDWSTSPLGHPATWPRSLRRLVKHMLHSSFPMFLAWGPELGCLYNDAYTVFLGDKHPSALGSRFPDVWSEFWQEVRPLVEQALAGQSPHFEDMPLVLHRNGKKEELWFTFSYSPVFDDDDNIAGMLCILTETTQRVLAERRQKFLLKLADMLQEWTRPADVMAAATRLIGEHFSACRVGYGEIDDAAGKIKVERSWAGSAEDGMPAATRSLEMLGPAVLGDLRQGRTVRLDDVTVDARSAGHAGVHATLGARAALYVPLLEARQLTAVLFLHHASPRHWTNEDVLLVGDVARRTWDAVKRARAEEMLRDESRMLELLNETGRIVSSTLDLKTLLQAITDTATKLSGAKFGAFFYTMRSAENDLLTLYTLSGAPREAFEKLGQPRSTVLFGPIFNGEAVVRIDDVTRDPRYGRLAPHHGMPPGHLPVRSYLAVPVLLRSGEPAGGLLFGHPEPGVFSERTERLVNGVAAQAATAIDNARLYEAAQQAAEQRRQALAREQQARAEAERLSKAKDEFLAMLAHELRNPLAPISSAAELLKLMEPDAEHMRTTSDIIVRQVGHMTGLIDDLLDVSRVTRGLVSLKHEAVDIKRVVADAIEQARPAIDSHRHHLAVQLSPGSVHARGDHKRLVQVLVNLLTNAAKYTPDGGTIAIRMEDDAEQVRCHVEDNGIGMSPELLPNVFELFVQAERSSDRSQGGLGLGLALVKSLVQLHGGSVSAHSAGVGQGSRFTVVLPRIERSQAEAPADSARPLTASACALRVLVVDDNADAGNTLALLLQTAGHAVTVHRDSESALACAGEKEFDACLLDIGLPGMDGNALAHRLRAMETGHRALLVAVTGYGQQFDREKAMRAGFDDYFVKPANPARLLTLLERHAATAAAKKRPAKTLCRTDR